MAETTFTKFTPKQAADYAAGRGHSYAPDLYNAILDYHDRSPKAQHELVCDVGCGPGKVAYDFLPFFDKAIGVDPGVEMIEAARNDKNYAELAKDGKAKFEVKGAEDFGDLDGVQGKVDLITVAMAVGYRFISFECIYRTTAVLNEG